MPITSENFEAVAFDETKDVLILFHEKVTHTKMLLHCFHRAGNNNNNNILLFFFFFLFFFLLNAGMCICATTTTTTQGCEPCANMAVYFKRMAERFHELGIAVPIKK
jgi:hypothetical protein